MTELHLLSNVFTMKLDLGPPNPTKFRRIPPQTDYSDISRNVFIQDRIGECHRAYPTTTALHPANRGGGSLPHPYGCKKTTFQDDNFQNRKLESGLERAESLPGIPCLFGIQGICIGSFQHLCHPHHQAALAQPPIAPLAAMDHPAAVAGHARTLLQWLSLHNPQGP